MKSKSLAETSLSFRPSFPFFYQTCTLECPLGISTSTYLNSIHFVALALLSLLYLFLILPLLLLLSVICV
jgi:hypothetical protein